MDPITGAIVAALTAGVAELGKGIFTDAYKTLKAALKRKCGAESATVKAVESVEEKPASEARQAVLAEEVAEAGLAQDPDLTQLAQALLEALQSYPAGREAVSKYNIQISGGQVGVIGDNTQITGGIHLQ